MTRETKIGLLVGLAFIIVIGILLSDHFTSTIQPPPADLTVTEDIVNRSIVSPGQGRVRERQSSINPDAVRPDREIIAGPSNSQVQIDIGPGSGARSNDGLIIQSPRYPQANQDIVEITPPIHTITPGGSELTSIPETIEITPAPAAIERSQPVKAYKAEPGDTLSKMARRHLGADTEANREAIAKLNPSLKDPPHRVIAGRSYNIPVSTPSRDSSASATPVSPAREVASRDSATQAISPTAEPLPATDSVYITKPRDTLWRIAVEQVGSPSAVSAIKELNKDVLKNGDVVRPNMKLKLPPKQVAQID